MKNKGFTLVELLAVIAILAILVIVAMPNVLSMFNDAKVNTFVTDVQKIMDTAIAEFTGDAFSSGGKTIYYSSTTGDLAASKLNIDTDKEYFIEMDRHGEFKRVIVYDENYCYDVYNSSGNGDVSGTKSKMIFDKINKTSVVASDVWDSGDDKIDIVVNGNSYTIKGCEGITTVEGKDTNVVLDKVNIDGVEYEYIPGMTWADWVKSKYSKNDFEFTDSSYYSFTAIRHISKNDNVIYTNIVCNGCTTNISYNYGDAIIEANAVHQIIKDEDYDIGNPYFAGGILGGPGDRVYDFNDNDGKVIYEQQLKVMP